VQRSAAIAAHPKGHKWLLSIIAKEISLFNIL